MEPRNTVDRSVLKIYVSPSQVKTWRSCARLWAFQKIERKQSPQTEKQSFGERVHKHLEDWVNTGAVPPDTIEGRVAKQGIVPGLLPKPKEENAFCEQKFEIPLDNNVVLTGFADVVWPRKAQPTIIDYKTTSDLKWAMTQEQMLTDPQVLIYSMHLFENYGAKSALARWIYLACRWNREKQPVAPKGMSVRAVEQRRDSKEFQLAWERLLVDVHDIAYAKRMLDNAHQAQPNPESCGMYGGCSMKSICKLNPGSRTASLFAKVRREKQGEDMSKLQEKLAAMKAAKKSKEPDEVVEAPKEAPAKPAPKKKKASKKTKPVDDPVAQGELHLYIDCQPVRGVEFQFLTEALSALKDELADGVDHWSLAGKHFNDARMALLAGAEELFSTYQGAVVAFTGTPEANIVLDAALKYAKVVVR